MALILLYRPANVSYLRAMADDAAGRWFIGLLTAEWLCTAIATISSSNWALSLDGGTWQHYGLISETGLLLFVLLASGWLAQGLDNMRALLEACTFAGALASLYGIAQYFGLDPFFPREATQVGDQPSYRIVRPPGTLGHADYFADWLVVVAFFALALRFSKSNPGANTPPRPHPCWLRWQSC